MALALCPATPADAAAVFDVIAAAFAIPPGSDKWQSRKRSIEREAQTYQVLTLDGRIVGAVHVADDKLRVGRVVVRKADVGHVSIRPELQGRGYGTAMMTRLVERLRQDGYDVSRLGGRIRFYSRFGWVPFPRRFVEFEIGRLAAEAFDAMVAPEGPGTVRHFEAARDSAARDALRRQFNAHRTGALNPGPPPAARPFGLVYERDGQVLGYLGATLTGVDHTPFEAALQIGDAACGLDCPAAVGEMVKRALRIARDAGVTRVSARLPFDRCILDALSQAGIGFSTRELEGSPAGNMLQVIDIGSLFAKLAPELEARLAASASSAWIGSVALEAEGRRVALSFGQGRVAVHGPPSPSFELRLTQAELLRLVLGLNTIDELSCARDAALRPAERTLLRDLFPIQPTASGPWG